MTATVYARGMAGRARKINKGPRFNEFRIAERINAARQSRNLEIKDFCAQVGWGKSDYTKKIVNVRTAMSMLDFEKVAAVLEGPPGWPFIDTREGEIVQDYRDLLAKRAPRT